MADYYSILARAVQAMDRNTPAARRRLYDRARSALLLEMQNADPPIPRSEVIVAQVALETAIGQVEADAALAALEKSVEHVERDGAPTVRVHPNPVASSSLTPTRTPKPRRLPADQNHRRGSLFGIWKLFWWRPTRSTEISEEEDAGSDTWLTELLQRTSQEQGEDYQDFAPKRASTSNVYSG